MDILESRGKANSYAPYPIVKTKLAHHTDEWRILEYNREVQNSNRRLAQYSQELIQSTCDTGMQVNSVATMEWEGVYDRL